MDPNGEAFESLKNFCIKIGEGRLCPETEVLHYSYLDHPVVIGEKIMVLYNKARKLIFLAEVVEGMALSFDDPSFFYYWHVGGQLFPETAVLDREGVTLSYSTETEGSSTVRKVSHKDYAMLKMLFDLENPFPWKESQSN